MMVYRARKALLLLAILPGAALAQRGIMGGRGALTPGRGAGTLAREAGVQIPKYVNAVNLLVEHRRDLALSDSQFVTLLALKRTLDSTNVPLLRKLDSVQRIYKNGVPLFSTPSAARRDSIAEARAFVSETLAAVRDNISAARETGYLNLSATQLSKAREIEGKAEQAAAADNERNGRAGGRGGEAGSGRGPAG